MATPDVRVRLSAEGLQEVIDALRKVQAESGKAKDAVNKAPGDARKGFLGLNSVLGSTRRLLGAVGIATSAVAFVRYVKGAGDAALQTGLLAESLGSTVPKLTALQIAAAELGIPLEQIEIKIGQFSDQLSRLIAGEPKAVQTFRKLGLSAADFPTQDTVENFEAVLKALGRLEDGYQKVTLASDVFGRAGTKDAALLPLGNLLAQETEAAKAFRQRVGELVRPDVDASIRKVTANLSLLNRVTQGLAQTFIAGLAPAASRALRSLSESMTTESGAFVKAVELMGEGLGRLFLLLVAIPSVMIAFLSTVAASAAATGKIVIAQLKGDYDEVARISTEAFDKIDRDRKAALERYRKDIATVFGPSLIPSEEEISRKQIEDLIRGYAQALQLLEIEVAGTVRRQQLLLQGREEDLRASYERGLVDLRAYFAERVAIAEREGRLESDAIRRRLAALESAPELLRNEEEIAKLRAQLRQADLLADVQLAVRKAQIARDQVEAVKQLEQAELKAIASVAEAQGRSHEARSQQIQQEQEERERQLRQQNFPEDEAARIAAEEAAIKRLALQLDIQQTLVTREQLALEDEIRRIRQDAAEGKISEAEAEKRVLDAEARRIPQIQKILEGMRAIAVELGNQDIILQIDDLLLRLREGATQVQNDWVKVGDIIQSGLVNTLSQAGRELGNLHALWISFRDSVLQGLQDFFAQKLVTSIADSIPGLSDGGRVRRFASGGPVEGPGTETSDSVLIYASRGEYVVRAAAVKKPGVLPLLEDINRGQTLRYRGGRAAPLSEIPPVRAEDIDATFYRGGRVPGYATGGVVGGDITGAALRAPGAAARVDGEIMVRLAPGLVGEYLRSREGRKDFVKLVQENRRTIREILGDR